MEVLIPLLAIGLIFGLPVYWVKRRFDLKERQLIAAESSPAERRALQQLREERKLLQARVENLEAIICDTNFELDRRIAHLAAEQSRLRLGAPASPASPAPAAADDDDGETNGSPAANPDPAPHPNTVTEAAVSARPRAPNARSASRVAVAPLELSLGEVVANRYRIDQLLGRGGMGAVYLAHDEVLGESVALKVISSVFSHRPPEIIDRFRREASAARKISSRNVIRIHDLGEAAGGQLYISMEYVPGRTLADMLEVRRTLSPEDTRTIIGQVCEGLTAAHDVGVIHRDLKPSNILISDGNAVKIIDFGLAKTAFLDGMTATGLMLGTPEYMSPEQVRGLDVDARSDIYSLGALTYHAVTGKPPFIGPTPIAVGFAHCNEAPRPPSEIRADVTPTLNAAILAALAKNPADRPGSADEFRRAL